MNRLPMDVTIEESNYTEEKLLNCSLNYCQLGLKYLSKSGLKMAKNDQTNLAVNSSATNQIPSQPFDYENGMRTEA
ncbi:hypothetical protein TNCT_551601 [Trichonephila clavata]|uniref:Uncharacterized protein n=1 Tax=Trichonephila clavata TaxID=2740835 RepID=A0A8X6IY79_TRICU|nr:hypothetical protein TNCT_551601 [Trichonephila clavata]